MRFENKSSHIYLKIDTQLHCAAAYYTFSLKHCCCNACFTAYGTRNVDYIWNNNFGSWTRCKCKQQQTLRDEHKKKHSFMCFTWNFNLQRVGFISLALGMFISILFGFVFGLILGTTDMPWGLYFNNFNLAHFFHCFFFMIMLTEWILFLSWFASCSCLFGFKRIWRLPNGGNEGKVRW